MRYTVRNEDGELTFESLTHLRSLYEQGLVGPEDQVRAADSEVWRKVSALPELRGVGPQAQKDEDRWFRFGVIALLCLSASLACLVKLRGWKAIAGATTFAAPVLLMSQRAMTAQFKKR